MFYNATSKWSWYSVEKQKAVSNPLAHIETAVAQDSQFVLFPALNRSFGASVYKLGNDSYLNLNLSTYADLNRYEIEFNYGFKKNLSDVLKPVQTKSSNRLVLLVLIILGGAAFILLVLVIFRYIASREEVTDQYKASFNEKSTPRSRSHDR